MIARLPERFLGRVWAPVNPMRALAAVFVVSAFLILILMVAMPGGVIPGVVDSRVAGGAIVLDFMDGDRYFWLLAEPAEPVKASVLLAQLSGDQSISRRVSFDSWDRQYYDEERGGEDFLIQADYLYEVAGVFTPATVEFAAKPGTTGTDFLGQIQEGSNRFLRRLAGFTASIPGIIWEDLKKIRAETKALFTGEPRAAPGEPGSDAPSFVDRAMTSWPILAGIVLLVILAPFIGLDNVFTGFLAAVALAVAGFWVLAVGAILVGYLMDDNAPGEGNFVQSLLLTGYLKGGDVKGAYPKVFSGVLLFIATAIVAGVLAWLGHNHLATIALLLGGAIVIFVISTGARDPKGKLRPSRLGVLPAVVMLFLGAAMAVWMAILGFAGYAWVFLFFSTVLALMAVYSMIGTAFWGQKKAKAHVDQPLEESRKGLKWAWGRLKDNDHTQASVGAWGELGFWAKFVVWISALGVWLAAVAFGSGQFLLGGIYTVVTLFLLAIVFEIFIPRFMVQLRGEHAAAEEAIAE